MKKTNFLLLTKQGLRGVFKYKTQFILIVLLGFFASLILSVTNSINDRMTSEYNRTMHKVNKFDYYEEQALENVSSVDTKSMVPIMDFISDEYLKDKEGNSIAYNVNLSTATESKETFITKAFASEEFKNAFTNLINNPNYTKSWFDYKYSASNESTYYNAYGLDAKSSNINKTNYWNQFTGLNEESDYINLSPLEMYTNQDNYIAKQLRGFTISTINILKEELKKDVKTNESEIKKQNSLFGILFKNDTLKSEDIFIDNNLDYSLLTKERAEINTYMDIAFSSLVMQINKMIHDYVQYYMEQAISESENKSETSVLAKFTELSGLKNENPSENNSNKLYSWLFAKDFSTKNKDNIYETGAKGQIAHVDSKGNIQTADALTFLDNGNYIENKLKDKAGFIGKDNYNKKTADISSTYFVRQKLLGQASGVNVYSRLESLYSDNAAEKHYRMVVMDEWIDKNITIYEGHMPRTRNEILLNPQYAKANKIKIGSNIKIGSANLVVSGFAADPYTNFPIADLTVPFPNNKKGGIIYLNKDIMENVLTTSEMKVTTTNVYRFLTVKDKSKTDKNISLFKSLNYNFADKLSQDNSNIASGGSKKVDYDYSFSNYKGSPFSYSWELTPMALKTFSIVSYIVCIIILAICLITMLIAIRKTIHFNAGEIGILKALGTKNSQIAFSYISYGLVLLLVVVPLSWFIGGFAQESFCKLFLSYTGGAYNQAQFNGTSLAILMLLFGGFTIVVSYITAMLLINKPVLEIINKKETVKRIQWMDNLKLKMTKNTKFTTKFSIELAISGLKPTLVSTFTVLISTLLITTSMAIPGMVNTAVSSYYKNVKYSNKLDNLEPIGNSPLSKTTLSAWEGADYYDNYLNNVKGNFGTVDYLSDSVTNVSGNTDYSMIPKFLYDVNKKQFNWSLESLTKESLLQMIGYIFGNNITQTIGRAINIADIQRIIEWSAHEDNSLNLDNRIKNIDNLTAVLAKGLPPILSAVFPGDISSEEGDNWKDQIMSAILSQTPSYVKSYLSKGENRFNQYTFGWTFTNYIPGDDDFYTTTKFSTNNGKQMTLTGLQSNQKAYNLKPEANKMYLDDESVKELEEVLNGNKQNTNSIKTKSGFDLYSNGTINIPVTMNDQAKFSLNKAKSSNIAVDNFIAKRLIMTQDGVNIPNSAWIYDDNDWAQNRTDKQRADWSVNNFLDPSTLDVSKFTMSRTFNYENNSMAFNRTKHTKSIADKAMAFANIYKDSEDDLKSEVRPYYTYDNLFLIVPKDYEDSLSKTFAKGAENKGAYGYLEEGQEVPQSTIDAWNKAVGKNKYTSANQFMWIRPYSQTFDPSFTGQQEPGSEMGNLLSYKNSFFRQNFLETKPGIIDKDVNLYKDLKINLVPVSTVDVYGSNIILADQNLTNLMHGFSTSQYIPYNYVYEKEQKGSYKLANGQEVKTYNWNTTDDLLKRNLQDQIWGTKDQKNYSPSKWFTGIMSQSKEPYFLTSQASFSKSVRTGEYTLSGESQYYDGLEMDSVEFLTEQKALINQIANLVLTIAVSFIVVIVITATLSMIIITDLYVNQYRKFMIVMKSLGYSNWKVIKYSFGAVTILAGIATIVGMCGSAAVVLIAGLYIKKNVGSIPIGLSWWLLLISAILIITSYLTSIAITTYKIRKESPVSLMK
ncbi:ABC transporter permease [Spiroplasma sp. BIUS-1]|uniref:ABC transporter permease n=1 Tax=Spiroplasma sp. BIUS-1 TaxID=216964 RepID=UPI0013973718|nr:ABC transporter permease [Spiroplasma sp. BIUS-1]QHX37016.1 hypothetical protein SBIUS_v1c07630 [Spiroplasma sp. BIUS-1]